MANNNDAIFNAALTGFLSGIEEGWITSATASVYASIKNAAVAFATEMDSKIPLDGAMNANKAALVQSIVASVFRGRLTTVSVASSYSQVCSAIAALYDETVPSLA